MTYDDHSLIRELYRDYCISEASWTYSGNDSRIVGRELIITNYDPSHRVSIEIPKRAA